VPRSTRVSAPLTLVDAAAEGDGTISIPMRLADGREVALEGTPEQHTIDRPLGSTSVIFLPAAARASKLLVESEPSSVQASRALEIFQQALPHGRTASRAPAITAATALEACCATGVRGLLLLVEEPELYLRPQAQRYLYRILREFAACGNQVIYSTKYVRATRRKGMPGVHQRIHERPRPDTPRAPERPIVQEKRARNSTRLLRRSHVPVLGLPSQ
jgi:hypothetical protein